ncbi:demethylmenaquinone methyltransferase-like isoform X2 [Mya arenaria]|uniref:demethylmenaquinone methyltransferase-like isoform X2 n=1 Tax=Mya arenaria TaxID=6604 RepID=UPI0022E29AFD|nr:demethylmenaquinone methyltransferase-like isoform X2 [Mya arenaria]
MNRCKMFRCVKYIGKGCGVRFRSTWADFSKSCHDYDRYRRPVGSDLIAGMSQFYTGKQLKDLHILDVGCGTGLYGKALLDLGLGKMSLIDASKDMLSVASNKLATYIEQGCVLSLDHYQTPPLPYQNGSFDVVLLNMVIHHLDSVNGRTFPNAIRLLKEAEMCLKKKGIVAITTIPPSNAMNYWTSKQCYEFTHRTIQYFPSLDEYETMFIKSGLKSVQKLTFLGPGLICYENIIDSNGYLDQSWVNSACVFELATDEEMIAIHEKVHGLVQSGMWQQWTQENDTTEALGGVTLLVCHKD